MSSLWGARQEPWEGIGVDVRTEKAQDDRVAAVITPAEELMADPVPEPGTEPIAEQLTAELSAPRGEHGLLTGTAGRGRHEALVG